MVGDEEVDIDAVMEEDIDEKICEVPELRRDREGKEMRVLEVRKQWRQIGRRRVAIEDIETPIFIFGMVFLQWFGEIQNGKNWERIQVKETTMAGGEEEKKRLRFFW